MNVDSSSSVNGGGMIYSLFLPLVDVGRTSAVNVGVCYLFRSSVNVDNSSLVNDSDMIYFLFLPSVNVGTTSTVNFGVLYLFAIFSER